MAILISNTPSNTTNTFKFTDAIHSTTAQYCCELEMWQGYQITISHGYRLPAVCVIISVVRSPVVPLPSDSTAAHDKRVMTDELS